MNWRFWRKKPKPPEGFLGLEPGLTPLTELMKKCATSDKGQFAWFEDSTPAPLKEVWNGEEYFVLKSNFNPLFIVDQACNVIWREGETIEQLNQDVLVRVRDGAKVFRTIRQEPDGCFTVSLETMIDRVVFWSHIPFSEEHPYTD